MFFNITRSVGFFQKKMAASKPDKKITLDLLQIKFPTIPITNTVYAFLEGDEVPAFDELFPTPPPFNQNKKIIDRVSELHKIGYTHPMLEALITKSFIRINNEYVSLDIKNPAHMRRIYQMFLEQVYNHVMQQHTNAFLMWPCYNYDTNSRITTKPFFMTISIDGTPNYPSGIIPVDEKDPDYTVCGQCCSRCYFDRTDFIRI